MKMLRFIRIAHLMIIASQFYVMWSGSLPLPISLAILFNSLSTLSLLASVKESEFAMSPDSEGCLAGVVVLPASLVFSGFPLFLYWLVYESTRLSSLTDVLNASWIWLAVSFCFLAARIRLPWNKTQRAQLSASKLKNRLTDDGEIGYMVEINGVVITLTPEQAAEVLSSEIGLSQTAQTDN
jgi:hypothetical protein